MRILDNFILNDDAPPIKLDAQLIEGGAMRTKLPQRPAFSILLSNNRIRNT